jgi:hypothetical protein
MLSIHPHSSLLGLWQKMSARQGSSPSKPKAVEIHPFASAKDALSYHGMDHVGNGMWHEGVVCQH